MARLFFLLSSPPVLPSSPGRHLIETIGKPPTDNIRYLITDSCRPFNTFIALSRIHAVERKAPAQ